MDSDFLLQSSYCFSQCCITWHSLLFSDQQNQIFPFSLWKVQDPRESYSVMCLALMYLSHQKRTLVYFKTVFHDISNKKYGSSLKFLLMRNTGSGYFLDIYQCQSCLLKVMCYLWNNCLPISILLWEFAGVNFLSVND